MRTNIVIYSEELTKEDIQLLLQSVRDCEQESFPDKEVGIAVFVPELTVEVLTTIISGIKPPFKHGPMVFKGGAI